MMARVFRVVAVVCALGLSAATGMGQSVAASPAVSPVVDEIRLGQSAVPLYGPWKFTVGDSPIDPATGQPVWAERGFDDSRWETVDLAPKDADDKRATDNMGNIGTAGYRAGWTARGHERYSGYAWYRVRVRVHAAAGETVALGSPWAFDDAYQVFVDGRLLGGFGFEGKEPQLYYAKPMVFPLPGASSPPDDGTQVVAFRFWMSPTTLRLQYGAGGFHVAPMIGRLDALSVADQLYWLDLIRQNVAAVPLAAIDLLLAFMALTLFLFNRTDKAYLWMGLLCLVSALGAGEFVLSSWTQWFSVSFDLWFGNVFVLAMVRFAWFMLAWSWFGLERPRWLIWVMALLMLVQAAAEAGAVYLLPFLPRAVERQCFTIRETAFVTYLVLMGWIAFRGVRKMGLEGWLIVPLLVLSWWDRLADWRVFRFIPNSFTPFGILVSTLQVETFVIALSLCALLLRRWFAAERRQREMAFDVKQAQEVQQVILPEARAVFPGLVVESDYRPAREVGGDFFQILPCSRDGSLLIVAGDVTGKGLKAGMVVALLIGAIRTAAQYDPDPLSVLQALNQRLQGRSDSQATCLALRIESDGAATLANAGHMAPYLNGELVEMEGALPLGMIDGAEFSVMRFQLRDGDRLMLMSDGIAEATDASGKLFGFERVQELMRSATSATQVASAAQAFGQEDDISVISVTRTAVAGSAVLAPALS